MTRKLRKQREGAIYHVMAKGNQGSFIFREKHNKRYFLKCLECGSQRFEADIFAFCIMGNHYHLLLRTREANLSSLMHFIGTSYASRLREQGNLGHIFSGRFKSVHVDSWEHALFLSRYVHLNPRKAGIVEHPEEYPWSSCMSYLIDRGPFGWVHKAALLEMLSPSTAASRKIYADFLDDPERTTHRFPRFPDGLSLAKAVLGGDRYSREAAAEDRQDALRPIDILYKQVLEIHGENCLAEGRAASVSDNIPRLLYIYAAKEYLLATHGEIQELLNGCLCASSITRYLKRSRELLEENGPGSASLRRDLDTIIAPLLR